MILALVISFFMIRPSFLGEQYNVLGVISFVIIAACIVINARVNLTVIRASIVFILATASYLIYRIALVSVSGGLISNEVNTFVLGMATSVVSIFLFSYRLTRERFFNCFVLVLSLLSISSFITLLLTKVVPLENLRLFSISIKSYGGSRNVYLPFTLIYQEATKIIVDGERALPRAAMFFRESGIAQAFLCFCAALLLETRRRFGWVAIGCMVLGLVAARSTAGFLVFAATMIFKFITSKRFTNRDTLRAMVIGLPILIAVGSIAIYDPTIGVGSKLESTSFSDRSNATDRGANAIINLPFGEVLSSSVENSGINMIASAARFGTVGFLLSLLPWISVLVFSRKPMMAFGTMLPLFVTSLALQPIDTSPGIYVILAFILAYYRDWSEGGVDQSIPPGVLVTSNETTTRNNDVSQ